MCYGQPFYAGWGLTEDMLPIVRRTRHLPLDGLVAGALILYPTYISRLLNRGFSTPEQAMDELLAWRHDEAEDGSPFWRKVLRMVLRIAGRQR